MAQFRGELTEIDPSVVAWHMRRGDLSRWFAEVVQDRELSIRIGRLERELSVRQRAEASHTRDMLIAEIDERYLE